MPKSDDAVLELLREWIQFNPFIEDNYGLCNCKYCYCKYDYKVKRQNHKENCIWQRAVDLLGVEVDYAYLV
jgi:hypothetical protein